MNRYGQMAMDYTRRFRPAAFAEIGDPDRFFAEAGDEMQAAISSARDQILGVRRPGEDAEQYRLRSYQALGTAEELVLSDHHLLTAPPEVNDQDLDLEDDPELATYYRTLAVLDEAIVDLHGVSTTEEE